MDSPSSISHLVPTGSPFHAAPDGRQLPPASLKGHASHDAGHSQISHTMHPLDHNLELANDHADPPMSASAAQSSCAVLPDLQSLRETSSSGSLQTLRAGASPSFEPAARPPGKPAASSNQAVDSNPAEGEVQRTVAQARVLHHQKSHACQTAQPGSAPSERQFQGPSRHANPSLAPSDQQQQQSASHLPVLNSHASPEGLQSEARPGPAAPHHPQYYTDSAQQHVLYSGAGVGGAVLQLTLQQLLDVSQGSVGSFSQPAGRVRAYSSRHDRAAPSGSSKSAFHWAADVQQLAHQQLPGLAPGPSGSTELEAESQESNARPPAVFMLDSMCSRLCRWLRYIQSMQRTAFVCNPVCAHDKQLPTHLLGTC